MLSGRYAYSRHIPLDERGLLLCLPLKRSEPIPKIRVSQKVSHRRYNARFRLPSHNENNGVLHFEITST